jgi:hypothetical protein
MAARKRLEDARVPVDAVEILGGGGISGGGRL